MKKIISLIFTIVFVTSVFSAVGNPLTLNSADKDNCEYFELTISFPDFEIIENNDKNSIKMDGYNYLSEPGKPLIPYKNLLIALPPDSIVESVKVIGLNKKQIPGFYDIIPASKSFPACSNIGYEKYFKEINEQWNENYKSTYSSDEVYPNTTGELVSRGTYHKISYASVSVYPFIYHPLSKRLFNYESAKIKIYYKKQKCENYRYDSQIDEEASNLFINYDNIKNSYQPYLPLSSPDIYNYVIITSTDLYTAIETSKFINWKTTIGFNVKVVNITDPLINNQEGFDLAEQIRNFLRHTYSEWGIEYVLIVGEYDNVPMRYCYPNKYNHKFNLSDVFGGEYPTDSYYADISYPDNISWDSDVDGFYGEYRDDNPDFLSEVLVGRIPTDDSEKVIYALEKIMAFEMDTGEWKNNVLHAGAILLFSPFFDDGASGVDYIENELMTGMTISHYSEQEGEKISDYQWNPLTEETFTSDWRSGKYGFVNWFGHGWSNRVSRWVWENDLDEDNRPDADELVWKDFVGVNSDLDDDYPSIVYCKSCVVGYPEPCPDEWPEEWRGNFGVDMLIKPSFGAAVAVISATRVTYLINEWIPKNIGFEFNKELIINKENIGKALFNAKVNYCENCTNDYRDFCNKFGYNLYGDPSLVYEGITAEGKPEKPILSGETNGKIKEEYIYSAISIDPNEDNLYYHFNWGDGTNSGWLGPIASGEEYNASHSWDKKGDYEVKVRVKDNNGLISEWSNPLSITMPKNKAINRPLINFLRNHPNLFPILRLLLERLATIIVD